MIDVSELKSPSMVIGAEPAVNVMDSGANELSGGLTSVEADSTPM